ncbi:MAG: hypothetical protein R2834_15250 [Rhodothermales bacterium]
MASNDKRSFSEEEVGKLISRAIALQEAERLRQKQDERGLSIEEVQHVAREAGIDPRYVVLAASDLEKGEAPRAATPFFGASANTLLHRRVPGQLNDEQIGQIVGEIRSALSSHQVIRGNLDRIGRTFEWSTPAFGSTRNILIRGVPEQNDTRIEFQENQSSVLVLFHIWWMMLTPMSLLLALVGAPWLVPFTLFLIALLTFFVGRMGAAYVVNKRREAAEDLLEKIERVAAQGIAPGAQDTEPEFDDEHEPLATGARLDLPDAAPETEAAPRRRRPTRRS